MEWECVKEAEDCPGPVGCYEDLSVVLNQVRHLYKGSKQRSLIV